MSRTEPFRPVTDSADLRPDGATTETCRNCGEEMLTRWCGNCGQHRRSSMRLKLRDIAANCLESLFDAVSAFPATMIGLWTRPGVLCRNYIEGQRKRYMNPFAFLLVAITVQVLMGWLQQLAGLPADTPEDSGELSGDLLTWLLLLSLLPLAGIWRWLFRSSGCNLAENYVFGLFLFSQLTWLETFILNPLAPFISEAATMGTFLVAWVVVSTWAGTAFYRDSVRSVVMKMLAATVVFAVFASIISVVVIEILRKAGVLDLTE